MYILLYQSNSKIKKKFTQMRLTTIGMSTLCCFMHPSKPLEVSSSLSNSGKWDLMHSFHSTTIIIQGTKYELKYHNIRIINCLELLAL